MQFRRRLASSLGVQVVAYWSFTSSFYHKLNLKKEVFIQNAKLLKVNCYLRTMEAKTVKTEYLFLQGYLYSAN